MTGQQPSNILGIDFGTSNSAAGISVNGKPHLIEIEAGQKTLPTSVFFDFSQEKTLFGSAANAALIQGQDGRFMRSLKSVLGTSLIHEKRMIMGEKLSFVEIMARFLRHIKTQAEAACWQDFDYALSGRPVHFHSQDAAKDAQALLDLTECYRAAGFKDVRFLYEPEAAALACGGLPDAASIGLIVDIGGGTSDFSLFRHQQNADGSMVSGLEILASHGVRVGGTNFDRSISVDKVMPLLGKGARIRNEMGSGTFTAPNAIFQDLATWEKIPFLYNNKTRNDVDHLHRMAVEKSRIARLQTVIDMELGHDLAFAVERGKIQVNSASHDTSKIDLSMVEPGFCVEISKADLNRCLAHHGEKIRDCALETLAMAGCSAERVDQVIFVGGSSLMAMVEQIMGRIFPKATFAYSDAFTAVVDGLALASAQPFEDLPGSVPTA